MKNFKEYSTFGQASYCHRHGDDISNFVYLMNWPQKGVTGVFIALSIKESKT